jgi:2-polyprenyl-3-methyl-5-hydroxy-6-metoxy-1,4-benzoquinol methylase
MLEPGAARRGGMPRYKHLGNRILSRVENGLAGMDLSEWHSGYRAYSAKALSEIPFESNSDGFDFDTQIILQLHEAGMRIVEIPIPTYYGDEISRVNGLAYARDVVRHSMRYRLHASGFGSGETAFASDDAYELKPHEDTSHARLQTWLGRRPPGRVLDLGCSDGALAERLRSFGHSVTGVDREELPGVGARVDRFVRCDLEDGLPDELGAGYDIVVAADVLEHVRRPDRLLVEMGRRLAPGGTVLVSVPNFGHWYPRARATFGRFDYDRRGILDRDHVRFFTRASFERLVAKAGFSVSRREAVGLPFDVLDRGVSTEHGGTSARRAARAVDGFGVWLRPTLCAYQFVYELTPRRYDGAAPNPTP